jgi:pimeloyl-ACP methyl ester carboxylesterase
MAEFVLVHGAWHGGWCWQKLARELEAAGHRVLAPDLPGHGSDETPHDRVDLQAYADRVCEAIDSLEGDVVLVGHSLGGLTISQAAEHRSDRIRCLVYLAAFVPTDAGSFAENAGVASPALHAAVTPSADGVSSIFDLARARDIFYADCSDEDVRFAIERLSPQPMGVFQSALQLSAERFGRIPRDYVLCVQDAALPAAGQQQMIARHPFRKVYRVERSHSPFLSAPRELAKILGEAAGD